MKWLLSALVLLLALCGASPSEAIHANSVTVSQVGAVSLPNGTKDKIVLSATFTVPEGSHKVFIQADGVISAAGDSLASVFVANAGSTTPITSMARVDWRGSQSIQQYTFNVIGLRTMTAGTYTVDLIARHNPQDATILIPAGTSGLTVLIDPAENAYGTLSARQEPGFKLTPANWQSRCVDMDKKGNANRDPFTRIAGLDWIDIQMDASDGSFTTGYPICATTDVEFSTGGDTITLGAYTNYCYNCMDNHTPPGPPDPATKERGGDAWGALGIDGGGPHYDKSKEMFSITDQWGLGAAKAAPMFMQRVDEDLPVASHTAEILFGEMQWNDAKNELRQRQRQWSQIVVLQDDDWDVFGYDSYANTGSNYYQLATKCVLQTTDPGDLQGDVDYCMDFSNGIGTGAAYNCPGGPRGELVEEGVVKGEVIASELIEIPEGHSGDIMVLAKTRVQGSRCDYGGEARMWIRVNGSRQGTLAEQGLAFPHHLGGISQRPLSAHAFVRGLSVGYHTLEVWVEGEAADPFVCWGVPAKHPGTFAALGFETGLSLLWFG